MLNDLERKLLRVLYNFSTQKRRMPFKPELERLTGRRYADIDKALNELVQQQYIFWPDRPHLQTIVILEGWERDQPLKPKTQLSSNLDYWTKY
ncbi:hypothetical protein SAMN04488542_1057 [Fontibacillus panacisegetis]|uniref:Uncharacterized protein n=1 Tax=Fontibacillus panacisegetis TaxID=670482 RepID=A0A1G7HRC5_9BACL|nr:hypothetical protein SAMN04488542_1057 [Fontibacillus panacisegetis]